MPETQTSIGVKHNEAACGDILTINVSRMRPREPLNRILDHPDL